MTDIYDAIMKAADHIERNPKEFDFWNNFVPGSCGTPGCALGWIGYFLGIRQRSDSQYDVTRAIGTGPTEFYSRMTELVGSNLWKGIDKQYLGVPRSEVAAACGRGLRLYAEKYHGEEKPKAVTPPDWNAIAAKWTIGDDVRSQEVAA